MFNEIRETRIFLRRAKSEELDSTPIPIQAKAPIGNDPANTYAEVVRQAPPTSAKRQGS